MRKGGPKGLTLAQDDDPGEAPPEIPSSMSIRSIRGSRRGTPHSHQIVWQQRSLSVPSCSALQEEESGMGGPLLLQRRRPSPVRSGHARHLSIFAERFASSRHPGDSGTPGGRPYTVLIEPPSMTTRAVDRGSAVGREIGDKVRHFLRLGTLSDRDLRRKRHRAPTDASLIVPLAGRLEHFEKILDGLRRRSSPAR